MIQAFQAAYRESGAPGHRASCASRTSGWATTRKESIRQLLAYYAFIAERAEWVSKSAVQSADDVRARIEAFREIGADELIFSPSVPDVDQVDLLAEAAGLDGVGSYASARWITRPAMIVCVTWVSRMSRASPTPKRSLDKTTRSAYFPR